MDRRIVIAAAAAVAALGVCSVALASPYASGVSESAGVVSFTLNEGGTVTVIRDGVPDPQGALAVGPHTFSRNGATNYSIQVANVAGAGYQTATSLTSGVALTADGTPLATPLQISDDNNVRNTFNSPRGVQVNRNPANGADFGLVYVTNSAAGGPTGGFPTPQRRWVRSSWPG